MEKLISVIIPVYNVEKYLKRCLESVINQTYKNLEIICIDDCSIDNSPEILKEYSNKYERIKIFTQTINQGQGSARNLGLEAASGEYIYFLDSDDWIDSDYIEKMFVAINNNDTDFVLNLSIVKEFPDKKIRQIPPEYKNIPKEGLFVTPQKGIANSLPAMPWTYLFKKSFLDKHNLKFLEGYIHEDVHFYYLAYAYTNNIFVINNSNYHYFQNNQGTIATEKNRDYKNMKTYDLIFDELNERGLLEKFNAKLFNTFNFYMVDTEEKYNLYKQYFLKLKSYFNEILYTNLDKFFSKTILNTESLEEYIKTYGKNVSISYIRYQKKSKENEFEKIQQMRKDLEISVENSVSIIKENPHLYENANENLLPFVYESILKKGDNAIDIGAHAGRHLAEIIRLVDDGKVFAFEPIPKMANFLKERFSKKQNVQIINKALFDIKGTLDFYIYNNSLEESGLSKREDRMSDKGDVETIKIDVDILDNYINLFNSLKFIKIDAESAELNILIGANRIINKFRPIISIEFGSDVKYFEHTKADLWNYLNNNNYYLADVFGNIFKTQEIFENYCATYDFILIPKENYEKFISNLKMGEKV